MDNEFFTFYELTEDELKDLSDAKAKEEAEAKALRAAALAKAEEEKRKREEEQARLEREKRLAEEKRKREEEQARLERERQPTEENHTNKEQRPAREETKVIDKGLADISRPEFIAKNDEDDKPGDDNNAKRHHVGYWGSSVQRCL